MRLQSLALPDNMDGLQGSGVRSSVQNRGRDVGGAPAGDRLYAPIGSELAGFVWESKLTWFHCGGSKLI